MKLEKILPLIAVFNLAFLSINAQNANKTIDVAMPFLLNRPDARSAAMGDVGAATSVDTYALYSNPSKIAFAPDGMQLGMSYTPLFRNLVNDANLANFCGSKKMGDRSSLGISVYFLSYGKVDITDNNGQFIQNYFPVEYTLDATFARKISDRFSMALTARYLHSDIHSGFSNVSALLEPASALAADVSIYYENDNFGNFNFGEKTWALGAVISNIGSKFNYAGDKSAFLPSNLKLGGAYSFWVNHSNQKLTFSVDLNKLLVPSTPEYDINGNVVKGKDPNRSVVSALFTSFGDAPGGFSEELSEISIASGIEYLYNESFALRGGYFYESPEKGFRQHFTMGTGLKFNNLNFDLAYVIPLANRSILKNSIQFSLGLNLQH